MVKIVAGAVAVTEVIDMMRLGADFVVGFERSGYQVGLALSREYLPMDDTDLPEGGKPDVEVPVDDVIERIHRILPAPGGYVTRSLPEKRFPEDPYNPCTCCHPSTDTFTVLFFGAAGEFSPDSVGFSRHADNKDGTVTFFYGDLKTVDAGKEILPYLTGSDKEEFEDGLLFEFTHGGITYVRSESVWYSSETANERIRVVLAYSEDNPSGRFVSYTAN